MKKFADNYYSATSVNDFDNSRDVEVLKYKYFMLGCKLVYDKLSESQNSSMSDEALPISGVVGQSEQFYCNDEIHYPEIGRCKKECEMCKQERLNQ